jgi:hypothetical protein
MPARFELRPIDGDIAAERMAFGHQVLLGPGPPEQIPRGLEIIHDGRGIVAAAMGPLRFRQRRRQDPVQGGNEAVLFQGHEDVVIAPVHGIEQGVGGEKQGKILGVHEVQGGFEILELARGVDGHPAFQNPPGEAGSRCGQVARARQGGESGIDPGHELDGVGAIIEVAREGMRRIGRSQSRGGHARIIG